MMPIFYMTLGQRLYAGRPEAFIEGYDAPTLTPGAEVNPYSFTDRRYHDWHAGRMQRRADEAELLAIDIDAQRAYPASSWFEGAA